MNRYLVIIVAAALGGAAMLTGSPARAGALTGVTAGGGGWGTAHEVPGTAQLNRGGNADFESVSCSSAGNCSAGGAYTDSSGHLQVFVVSQVNGTWGTAHEIPGTAQLNQGGHADFGAVSCSSAGNCSAGGTYTLRSGRGRAFVVSQVNGTWGTAKAIPGIAKLGTTELNVVSCNSAGNCAATGFSAESSYVVSQVNGTWGTAQKIPGIAKLSHGGYSDPMSLSCGAAGNCSAGGVYTDGDGGAREAFVVSEVHGTWHTAQEVPGTAKLNRGSDAELSSVSCSSAGNCSGGGEYNDGHDNCQAFVVSEVHGTWHRAEEVPGTAKLNRGNNAAMGAVSCSSAGNCSVAGDYTDGDGHGQVFVLSQVHGTWHTAKQAPGSGKLNRGGEIDFYSLSCSSAGNCSAGGFYASRPGQLQAFVASKVHGTWHRAEEVPGTAKLNQGTGAGIELVSCSSAGNCSAGGFYTDRAGHNQVFVVSRTSSGTRP